MHGSLLVVFVTTMFVAGGVTVSAMAAEPDSFSAAFGADYTRSDLSGGGHEDTRGFSAATRFTLDNFTDLNTGIFTDLNIEINGSYHWVTATGVNVNSWTVAGNLFWAPAWGRLGPTVTYASVGSGSSATALGLAEHAWSYGAFVEFFAGSSVTLAVKGGGLNGNTSFSTDITVPTTSHRAGSYLGGSVTGYPLPDIALNARIEYVNAGDVQVTSYGLGAEYLFSERLPVSVTGGYWHTDSSNGGGNGDNWIVGLKFYVGGPAPLVTRHRTGTLGALGIISGFRSGS
jgi:hypothetical protein